MYLKEEIFLDMKSIVPDSNPNTRHFLTKKIVSKIEKRIDERLEQNQIALEKGCKEDGIPLNEIHGEDEICLTCTKLVLNQVKQMLNS